MKFEYKTEFQSLKKSCEVLNNPFSFSLFGICNFLDFDTISILQVYCGTTHEVSLLFWFAAFDCQKEMGRGMIFQTISHFDNVDSEEPV